MKNNRTITIATIVVALAAIATITTFRNTQTVQAQTSTRSQIRPCRNDAAVDINVVEQAAEPVHQLTTDLAVLRKI